MNVTAHFKPNLLLLDDVALLFHNKIESRSDFMPAQSKLKQIYTTSKYILFHVVTLFMDATSYYLKCLNPMEVLD